MSRHRDIRNMDYSDDYHGYDDVYGHSVDDDIYISPSHTQFMYNRENSGPSKSDHSVEEDIQEEDEMDEELLLSEEDKAKLDSCLEHVKSVLAPMRMPRQELVKIVIAQKYDSERIIDSILKSQCSPPAARRDRDETKSLLSSRNSILKNKSPSISQKVEPQSKLNMQTLNTRNSLILKNRTNAMSSLANNNSGGASSDSKENRDLSASFLSKMTNGKNDNVIADRPYSSGISFLSRMKKDNSEDVSFLSRITKNQREKHEDDNCSNSPKISFLSKITKNPTEKNENSISSKSPEVSFLSKISQHQMNKHGSDSFSKSPEISFLSKISKNQIGSDILSKSPEISFLSKISKNQLEKQGNAIYSKSPEISFLSKISKNQIEKQESDIISKSPEISFSSKISKNRIEKQGSDIETESPETALQYKDDRGGKNPNNSIKNLTFKIPTNGITNTVNNNFNSFLERLGSKQTENSTEQTRSDFSLITDKSLRNDLSKLKLNESKSMPLFGSSKIDNSSGINLTKALQKVNFDGLKFRPTLTEESFDIPFVDSEFDEQLDDAKMDFPECSMDFGSFLATKSLPYSKKRPSSLGRIISLKYKIPTVKRLKKEKLKLDPRLVVYDFSDPSPDDQIKKYIRRLL